MAEAPLSSEEILTAAEEVLRRYGPAKATVVDVARALGVSHGTVYRHFPSKSALRAAVAERWLERTHAALPAIAAAADPAPERLRAWFAALYAAKRAKALDDPEMFATHQALLVERGKQGEKITQEHLVGLERQLAGIIAAGQAAGDFVAGDPTVLAHVAFQATAHYHDPGYAREWAEPRAQTDFEALLELVVAGLTPRQGLAQSG